MAVYIVAYDLNKETKRPPIVKDIKSYPGWAGLSESAYAISTDHSVNTVYNKLKKHLDENDHLYVVSLAKPWFGIGPSDVVDWLQSELPS